jgi:hypothetical protein
MLLPTLATDRELQTVVACARVSLGAEHIEQLRSLTKGGLDWERLLNVAERQGLTPLVCRHASHHLADSLPPEIHARMERLLSESLRRNVYLFGELLKTIEALRAHGIEAIPYKGPSLAEEIYGNLALRESSDLDLLLRLEDALRARDVLLANGFAMRTGDGAEHAAALLRYGCDFELHRSDGLIVELHWNIVPPYYAVGLDVHDLWERSRQQDFSGRSIRLLSPEDLLLVLCVHGGKHMWYRIAWLTDVAEMLRAYSAIDWNGFLDRARRAGILRLALLALYLANGVLGAPLPGPIQTALTADESFPSLASSVAAAIETDVEPGHHGLRGYWFRQAVRERWSDRVQIVLGHTFAPTPADWQLIPLPPGLFPLYVPLRLGRLSAGAARLLWQSLTRRSNSPTRP